MYLNRFIFPAPNSSYTATTFKDNLIYIERPKARAPAVQDFPRPSLETNRKSIDIPVKRSFKETNVFRKSTTVLSDLDLSKELYTSNPNKNKAKKGGSSPVRYENIEIEIDKEERPSNEQQSPPASIDELVGKEDNEKKDNIKKKKCIPGCFDFLRKHKEDKVARNSELLKSSQNETHVGTAVTNMSASCVVKLGNKRATVKIPCLYLTAKYPTERTMLFFHSNGEDLFLTSELLRFISDYLVVNILAVEYPGYGIYKGSPSEKTVLLDAEAAYDYLLNTLNVPEKEIIVAGRSLGSGPSTYLASTRNPGLLILISPFKSIRAVVRQSLGNIAQRLIKERFNNLDTISKVKCPVFILHGKNDTMIGQNHAIDLYNIVGSSKKLHLSDNMDHGSFDFFNDLIVPLKKFIGDLERMDKRKRMIKNKPPVEVLTDMC